jgi:hypothetical protein
VPVGFSEEFHFVDKLVLRTLEGHLLQTESLGVAIFGYERPLCAAVGREFCLGRARLLSRYK